jgi:hypothetical protein
VEGGASQPEGADVVATAIIVGVGSAAVLCSFPWLLRDMSAHWTIFGAGASSARPRQAASLGFFLQYFTCGKYNIDRTKRLETVRPMGGDPKGVENVVEDGLRQRRYRDARSGKQSGKARSSTAPRRTLPEAHHLRRCRYSSARSG